MERELTLTCPHCGFDKNLVEIEDEDDFGTNTFCNYCGKSFKIPDSDELEAEPAEPEPEPLSAPVLWTLPDVERIKWQYPAKASLPDNPYPLLNCPAVDAEGRIFACLQNEVVALSLESGQPEVLWTFPTGRLIPGSPSIGPDGQLRVHSLDGFLYCLTREGRLVWDPLRVGDPLGSATPLSDLEGNTWVCAATGGLLKVNSAGRTEDRAYLRSPVQFNSTGLIFNNTLYVGGEDQFAHAIDLTRPKGREHWDESQNHGRTGWYVNSALAVLSDHTLIVTSRDDHLYNFALNGQERWKVKLPGQALGSPIVDEQDRIHVGLNQVERGSLVQIDSRTQRISWSYPTDSPVESTPVAGADGLVYFGDNQGIAHAVNADGRAVWTEALGVPIRSAATLLQSGGVVFGLENGQLVALEGSSALPAGGWPKFLGTLDQSGALLG